MADVELVERLFGMDIDDFFAPLPQEWEEDEKGNIPWRWYCEWKEHKWKDSTNWRFCDRCLRKDRRLTKGGTPMSLDEMRDILEEAWLR